MKRSRGFTLLELIIVISMVSILAAIAIPSLSTSARRDELALVADMVAGYIYDSRALALAQKRCITVKPMNATGTAPVVENATTFTGRMSTRALNSGDCETIATITTFSNYTPFPFIRDLQLPSKYELSVEKSASHFDAGTASEPLCTVECPVIWRPSGFLRGDGDLTLVDDDFTVTVQEANAIGGIQNFIKIKVMVTGQMCTGGINQIIPTC